MQNPTRRDPTQQAAARHVADRAAGAGTDAGADGSADLIASADPSPDSSLGADTPRPGALPRTHFAHFESIATRWADNDVYGHVNNVVHYSFFDTAVNRYLISAGALSIHTSSAIGLVVQTQCQYFKSIAFPQTVHVGMRVAQLGRCSVRYELALFADDAAQSAAVGQFVHVYVDRSTRAPVPVPAAVKAALIPLMPP